MTFPKSWLASAKPSVIAAILGICAAKSQAVENSDNWIGVTLNVAETFSINGAEKTFIPIPNVLGRRRNGKAYLRIDPSRNPDDRDLVDILQPGIPFDKEPVRDQIAEILAGYPLPCLQTMSVNIIVAPIEYIDKLVPNVVDKRRITVLYVGGCVAQDLPECISDITKTGEYDFDIGMLNGVLNGCRTALEGAIQAGTLFDDKVYAANPSLPRAKDDAANKDGRVLR